MSRLTRYHQESLLTDEGGYYEPNASNYYDIVVKLGQIEDLEDELGCTLEVVFKALKDGIYHEFGDLLYDGENLKLHHIKKQGWGLYPIICDYDEAEAFFLKDYKKTWWLSSDLEE